MRTPKKLIYATLEGLSEKQLKEHHDVLYAGYVKKIDEIEEKLKKVDLATANATYSDLREFKALGLAARGWVVLGYDLDEKRLKNIVCDTHNQGGVWNMTALLVMDVYEHAYFIDYA